MVHTDLHIHSLYSSDGEFPVKDSVDRCIEKQVDVFSITDHNSVRATKEAIELAQAKQLKYIPGIEIDCIYQGINLHVLGYNINWQSPSFEELENDVSAKVIDSFDKMIENIQEIGFKIDGEAVLRYANGILPSGELIAEVMLSNEKYHTPLLKPYMEGGERSDMPYINFYLDYFAQGKPAFVPVDYISFAEAIDLIKSNGGVPIVAHPGLNLKGKESIAKELLDNGGMGLEVFNNYHTMEQIDYFAGLVMETKTLMTCGSDFHGKTKPLIEIGQFRFKEEYEVYLHNTVHTLLNVSGAINK